MTEGLGKTLNDTTKKAPAWAVGLVSIIVSVGVSFIGIYTIARSEVQQYLTGNQKVQETQFDAQKEIYKAVIGIVNNNSNQITVLSAALRDTQEENKTLSMRVSSIEKDLTSTKSTLEECESALTACGKGKR